LEKEKSLETGNVSFYFHFFESLLQVPQHQAGIDRRVVHFLRCQKGNHATNLYFLALFSALSALNIILHLPMKPR
jgi:hypothetical protein